MDDFEKLALRRRKPTFAEVVDIGKELLQDLHSRGLLNDDALEQLKSEKNLNQRASKLVDWLIESKAEKAFQEVCLALVNKYAGITKEMQTEVHIERGDVEIDDDVMKEAGVLVHRKFGTSRRFAETDKKDMTDLIAIKIQLSKEEWRHEMEQVREELHRYTDLCKQKDKSVRVIDDQVLAFMRKHETELVSKAHGMTSTSDILKSSLEDDDYIGKLKDRITFLLSRSERVIEERELITREREKLQKFLDAGSSARDGGKGESLSEQVDKYKKDNKTKDGIINRLRKMNDSFESEVEEKETQLKTVKEEHQMQKDTIAELELKIKELEAEKKVYEETAKHYADKKAQTSTKPSNNLQVKPAGTGKPTSANSARKPTSGRR